MERQEYQLEFKTQFLVRLQFPSSCKTKHFLFPRLVQIKFIFSDNVHVYIVYIFSFYNESLKLQFLSLVFKLPILWKSIFLFVYRSFVCLLQLVTLATRYTVTTSFCPLTLELEKKTDEHQWQTLYWRDQDNECRLQSLLREIICRALRQTTINSVCTSIKIINGLHQSILKIS